MLHHPRRQLLGTGYRRGEHKGLAALLVSAQGADQIGILDLPIEIADKGPTRQMRRGDLVQHPLLLLAGRRVDDRNQPLQPGCFEDPLDGQVVFLLGDGRQQLIADTELPRSVQIGLFGRVRQTLLQGSGRPIG